MIHINYYGNYKAIPILISIYITEFVNGYRVTHAQVTWMLRNTTLTCT